MHVRFIHAMYMQAFVLSGNYKYVGTLDNAKYTINHLYIQSIQLIFLVKYEKFMSFP